MPSFASSHCSLSSLTRCAILPLHCTSTIRMRFHILLLPKRPLCSIVLQSMYIFKQPRIGGKVKAHQDSTFIHTVPDTTTGFWIALEDATKENGEALVFRNSYGFIAGCLWALPGSHRTPLPSRFVRNEDNQSVSYKPPLPGIGFFRSLQLMSPADAYSEALTSYVPVECKKGSMVVIHGHVIHFSLANTSPKSRHAYTFRT